ncbi:Oidioi.mRNA.OKI2018_I69.chr2.g7526.t1.cds [Oikopleura dioica]|uniref:Oidioi.mRNA.OKI2018_I69.chr2.g7526.t1.cds n=1 Tax=Oikopleura dioica TaxID=34765 RepID=A0ABN7T8S7_OIKDI|nr:Oidioi.mRNA.OKI2018_I69.chr2.g7526.t1.cds [Oikopleura dioica]
MKENRKTTSNWVKRNLRRLIRRNYVRWATVIAKYPFCLIFISVVFTLICCLSFYFKTPYSIHSLPSENFSENKPEGYILQFEFENKHPTRKLIDETTIVIRNHEYLSNNCVHGESLKSGIPPELSKVIPNHSCLIFSPANLPDSDHEFPRNVEELFKRHKKAARILWGSKWKHYPPVVTVVLRHDIDPQAPWLLSLARDLFPASASENVSTPPRSGTEPLININFHFGYPATIDWLVYLSAGILLYVYYYVTVRKMNFLESSIITSAAVCGTLIMSLMVALGSCLALDLDIYVESGPFERGIGWIFIYYTFTFIAFESVLMLTKCIIETPVEEGPTERIAHGLLRGGCHLSKFFFAQLALTMIGSISEYSRSFSIFALIMVLSHSALLHSFFAPILFLELKQLERSEPKWIHKRSGAAIRLRRYWNSRNSGKFREDTLEDVTPLVDLGENHIDPIEGMFQPLRIKLLKTWAHKAILQKIAMIVFITWIGYRVFMVDPSEINNDYDDNDLEFAKLPWAYAFQLYSRDIRGKHLSFLPRIRVPFDPSGSRPIPIYQETKDSPRLTQFVSWKLVSLIIAFAAAIYKLYKAYERKIEINKAFVEYFDSRKASKSLYEDVALEKHLELEFTIDHVAQDEETGNLLLVDSSGSLTIFDASSNKIVAQKLSQISSYRASTTSDSRHHFTEDDNPLISDDETVWSIGIHQNNIILGF